MTGIYINSEVTKRIDTLLREKNLTKSELCTATGIKETTLSSYFNGDSKWGVDAIYAIAEYFNVTTDYLITGKQSDSEHYKQTAEKFRKIIIDLLNGNDNTKGQEVISGQLNVSDGTLSGVKQTP